MQGIRIVEVDAASETGADIEIEDQAQAKALDSSDVVDTDYDEEEVVPKSLANTQLDNIDGKVVPGKAVVVEKDPEAQPPLIAPAPVPNNIAPTGAQVWPLALQSSYRYRQE